MPMISLEDKHFKLFIDNEWTAASDGAETDVVDPSDNEVIGYAAAATIDDAHAAMDSAAAAFDGDWGALNDYKRGKLLWKFAEVLWSRRDQIAELETRNQGKTLREARADVAFGIQTLEYYAGLADKVQGETIPVPGPFFNYTTRVPVGVTVHIAPWNFPFQLAIRSLAPALAAGNTAVLKPATITPLSALAMAEAAKDAGLPPGAFNVVTGAGSTVGNALVEHPQTAAVAFTGSTETGQTIGAAAARKVVPCTLELGGKSPQVVFPDADLGAAAKGIGYGIFLNAGQMCWAGSRLLVHEDVADELLSTLKGAAEGLTMGPGMADDTRMGPLVSKDHMQTVMGYVETGHDEATLLTGGEAATEGALADGNFVQPTIFTDVPRDATIMQEEVFGPVLSVCTFSDEDEAVEIANDTTYGLYAGVWTKDLSRAHRVAAAIDAGVVNVNAYPVTFPQSPFVGAKESGIGHEQGRDAIEHYTKLKNVIVRL